VELRDEGRVMGDQIGDQDALNIIRDAISNLPRADRDRYRAIMAACEDAGCSIQMRLLPTEFRFNIARGLLTLFKTGDFHTDLVTAITRHVTGKRIDEIGRAISSLNLQQSRTFAWIAMWLVQGGAELIYHHETNQFTIKETINV
jgi:hypothetical protein